jgi:MSHA biogenesis protein MshG
MPKFSYQGRDASGKSVSGNVKTNSVDDVITYLSKQNIIPLHIQPIKSSLGLAHLLPPFLQFNNINNKDIMDLCRQLSILNSAGVPIIKSLNQLAQSTSKPILANTLSNIADDITAGKSFSAALKAFPNIFPPTVSSIAEIGENTGKLNEVLLQLSGYLEITITNHRRLMAALRYPTIVIIAIVFVIVFMSMFVIPKFSVIYQSFTMTLPLPTIILLGISNFMIHHWIILFSSIFVLIVGIRMLLSLPKIRFYWDKYKLKFPLIGSIQKRIVLSQFAWTFALIIRSGIPIIKGLLLSGNASVNTYFQNQILQLRNAIEHGTSFSQAAKTSNIFLPTIVQMIEVGEESGQMDEVLTEVARYYESEVDYDLKRLNELFEPILLIFVGSLVLGLALAVYLPIWDMVNIAKL